jgi:hypothetical protein
MPLHV